MKNYLCCHGHVLRSAAQCCPALVGGILNAVTYRLYSFTDAGHGIAAGQ
ncbi:hypothetical protein [Halopseudomonas maritima]|nr:hypothetical protein [Halopseudomonas maritima]UJJ30945.1 hypothetical protein HV822_14425 [Halopseudomonas maritima]